MEQRLREGMAVCFAIAWMGSSSMAAIACNFQIPNATVETPTQVTRVCAHPPRSWTPKGSRNTLSESMFS
ncbi:hypothetical protein V2H45_20865 [Tumidithrix elongata RA019]|uniref:Secreted protein n=1 Tax=Tumidithrix elongata BACA0141 TaxID=2716417 RepID=A0AAW9Q264_9CYAN|nr:hypothetical protein [Tumidithrix elongata RA019]